jgi:hypothetical protein
VSRQPTIGKSSLGLIKDRNHTVKAYNQSVTNDDGGRQKNIQCSIRQPRIIEVEWLGFTAVLKRNEGKKSPIDDHRPVLIDMRGFSTSDKKQIALRTPVTTKNKTMAERKTTDFNTDAALREGFVAV